MSPQQPPEPLTWVDGLIAFLILQLLYRIAGVQEWGFPQGLCPKRAERSLDHDVWDR